MIAFSAGVKVWIAGGVTEMRRGMNTLTLQVHEGLGRDPMPVSSFAFGTAVENGAAKLDRGSAAILAVRAA
jgi:transposase